MLSNIIVVVVKVCRKIYTEDTILAIFCSITTLFFTLSIQQKQIRYLRVFVVWFVGQLMSAFLEITEYSTYYVLRDMWVRLRHWCYCFI